MAEEKTVDVPFELWGALGEALDRFDETEDHPDPAVRAMLVLDAIKVVKAARACLEAHDGAIGVRFWYVLDGRVSRAAFPTRPNAETARASARNVYGSNPNPARDFVIEAATDADALAQAAGRLEGT